MSSLIPTISITDLKHLKVSEMNRLKSCEILSDGQYLGTIVFPATDYIRTQVEGLASLSNTQGGEEPEDIIRKEAREYGLKS